MKKQMVWITVLIMASAMVFSACGTNNRNQNSAPGNTQSAPGIDHSVPEEPASRPNEQAVGGLSFIPGTYEGEADGYGGKLKLRVTVNDTAIQSVEVTEHSETQGIGTNAIEQIPPIIVEKQSLAVDAISGCTVTSKAVLEAAAIALQTSGVDVDALRNAQDEPAQTLTTQILAATVDA